MSYELNLHIARRFRHRVSEDWLRQIATRALAAAGVNPPAELGLVVTDDKQVRQLNKTYRGVDHTTDVLSFALHQEPNSAPFPPPPDGVLHLGEVIISYPQAARQAEQLQHSIERELELLVIHGVLHLLGYDHDTPRREAEMRALEEHIIKAERR
jgi:probable rRNA maturation factor